MNTEQHLEFYKESIERIVAMLNEDQTPDYKDEWERGFDAGRRDAVRLLRTKL